MERSEFWETMRILVGKDFSKNVNEDILDWVEDVVSKRGQQIEQEEDDESVIAQRRRLSESGGLRVEQEIKRFSERLKLPKITCKFSHPQIRSRLEKLMGSNTVSLTDRKYMQRLQERILEDYAESMDKRIRIREVEELERVKNLVLNGRIPLSQAPPEMAQHPVMLIEDFCNRLIAERRAKIKIPQVKIPTYLYWDDTPDPESGLSIEKGHIFRGQDNILCVPIEKYLEADEDTDIKRGYMLTKEEFETIKYENPLVKQLMTCETVEEMYALADEIIGVLKTIDESAKTYEDVATEAVENV